MTSQTPPLKASAPKAPARRIDVVDRILYLAPGGHRIGTPDEVLRSEVLTDLYGTPVDVVRVRDRVIVVGGPDDTHHAHEGHEHPEPDAPHEVVR